MALAIFRLLALLIENGYLLGGKTIGGGAHLALPSTLRADMRQGRGLIPNKAETVQAIEDYQAGKF